jgi:hypothetical protein
MQLCDDGLTLREPSLPSKKIAKNMPESPKGTVSKAEGLDWQ